MKYMIKKPGQEPEIIEFKKLDLKAAQGIVEGHIEAFTIGTIPDIMGYCNDTGKFNGQEPNFYTKWDYIYGPVVLFRRGWDGIELGLNDNDIRLLHLYFKKVCK